MALVARGDCSSQALVEARAALGNELESIGAYQVEDDAWFQKALGRPGRGVTADALEQRVQVARERYYRRALGEATAILKEVEAGLADLPVGRPRWALTVSATLLQAMIAREQNRHDEEATLLRRLLRLNPQLEVDPDYYPPSFRADIDEQRRGLDETARYDVRVNTFPSDADVYVDGFNAGRAPVTLQLPSGSYSLVAARGGGQSFEHPVEVKTGTSDVTINLGFEARVHRGGGQCVRAPQAEENASEDADALALGTLLNAPQVALVSLETREPGRAWLAVKLFDTQGGRTLRDGGLFAAERPSVEDIRRLANFLVTGAAPGVSSEPPTTPSATAATGATDSAGATSVIAPAGHNPYRPVSYVLLGAAAAGLASAGAVRLFAWNPDLEKYQALGPAGTIPNTPEALGLRNSLETEAKWMSGLLIGSGVSAVAGAALYFLGAESEGPAQVSVTAGPTGASVVVGGRF